MVTIMPDPLPIDVTGPATRRSFAGASLRTGAYQLIPLPFVDDWLTLRQRKGMVRAVLEARGFTYEAQVPRVLAGGSLSLTARLGSMAKGLVLKPMRKIFRTVLFWVAARRAARAVVETYFLGRFLHHPAVAGQGGGTHLTQSDGQRLASVFQEVSKNLDLHAAHELVKKVGRLVVKQPGRSKEVTSQELQGVIEQEAPGFVERFDRLVDQKLTIAPRTPLG